MADDHVTCMIGLKELIQDIKRDFPNLNWTPRIRFGGLLDIPDEQGETKGQTNMVDRLTPHHDTGPP